MSLLAGLCALLLAACGGSSSAPAPSSPAASSAPHASGRPAASASATSGGSASAAAGASGAGGASGTGSAAAAPVPNQAAFDQLVVAAKQEGKVNVIVPPGDIYRQVTDVFAKKYGIQVELMVGNGNADIVPKVDAERKAGQYNWDVIAHSPGAQFQGLETIGAMDPLRPALVLPDALDDSKWGKGFADGWADKNKSYVYSFVGFVDDTLKVNRNVIPESQLSKLDQAWDPAFKGKIAMFDPRIPGAGLQAAAVWLLTMGEATLRSFLATQQPVTSTDRRQVGEWIVRGQYPIVSGVAPDSFGVFRQQGIDTSQVKPLDPTNPKGLIYTAGTGSLGLINRAPHPNAAKLFANWLLSQEGQAAYSKITGYNSRRLDVPVADPDYQVDWSQTYLNIDIEANYDSRVKAAAIAKEVLK